jgi:hypothetical protein
LRLDARSGSCGQRPGRNGTGKDGTRARAIAKGGNYGPIASLDDNTRDDVGFNDANDERISNEWGNRPFHG